MTGAGAPGAAGIIKCLRQDSNIRITVADAMDNAVGRYLADDFVKVPRGDDPSFIDTLLEVCKIKKIQLVLPLVTKELLPLSQNKTRFEELDIRVLVSAPEAIDATVDKAACYRLLEGKGIAVPTFFVANTAEEFIHAAFELGHPQKTFCFKPMRSNGSRGFRVVSDAIDESDMLFNHKPYNTCITYPHALKILHSKPFPPLLVSEYLPGDEYSVDCLARNGKAVLIAPRSRTKMVNGISVAGEFLEDHELVQYCKQIIEALGLHANIGIQVKRSEEGRPLLLEVNPRVQGTIVAALGAGVNLPLLAIKQELGLPIPDGALKLNWGTRFYRHWTEVFYR